MARAKSLITYPPEYFEIIRGCAIEGKRFTLNCEDEMQALSLRGKFYAFRGAIKREHRASLAREYTSDVFNTQNLKDYIVWVDSTVCWIVGSTLTYMPKSAHPDSILLRRALASPDLPTTAAIKIDEKSLLEVQQEADESGILPKTDRNYD